MLNMNSKKLKQQYLYKNDATELLKVAKKRSSSIKLVTQLDTLGGSRSILPSFNQIQDGFKNLISGLGGQQSKSAYTTYATNFCIDDRLLHSLWISNGISRKIVNAVSDDSTKNSISIRNDSDNLLYNKYISLSSDSRINLADKYRRHYGGSLIYIDAEDGQELWQPLNLNTLKQVRSLRVYSRSDTFFTNIHFNEDLSSENYGQPEIYTIIPKYTSPFNVHYSRILEYKGLPIPSNLDNGYRYYWGMSIIEPLWETMKKVGAGIENVDQLLYEITISIYKIKGLADLMCGGKWDTIKNIIDTTDQAKSTIRALLLDAEGHDYKRDSINFNGVDKVIELLFTLLSGESEVPVSRLLGKQLGGLNNEGQSELRSYYDMVKAHQNNELQENTQKLVNIINASKEFNNKIIDPIVKYNSPYQLTQKEELENRKIQSDIDHQQILDGMITNIEARDNRLLNGYSFEMSVEEGNESDLEVSVD